MEERKEGEELAPRLDQERMIDDINSPFASYRLAQGSTIMIIGGPV